MAKRSWVSLTDEERERWTMHLLADGVVELQIVPDTTDEAIRLLRTATTQCRRTPR